jgi:ClpP class serine protease
MALGINDLFWGFLIFSMLQPWLKQRTLEAARVRMIRRIEQQRGSRLILMIHRQETMAFLGFPILRYIDVHDAEEVIHAVHLTDPGLPLDIVLHTPGGLMLASMQIARAIRARKGKVTIFVPHYAMSGGTLLALAADEIVMDAHAVLGPVDPQVGQFPAASVVKAVARKDVNHVDDETLILSDVAAKALQQMRADVLDLIGDRMTPERAQEVADKLTQGTWTHDRPLGFQDAQQLGLRVSAPMPKEMYDLMRLFPQPAQRQPSVRYIPTPYQLPPTPPGARA